MFIVDAQVHVWSANTPERPWLAGSKPHREVPLGPDELLREMDAAGVYRAVLIPPSWDAGRNDLVLEAARLHPDRFAVMGRPDGKTTSIEKWREQPGMLGLRFAFLKPGEEILVQMAEELRSLAHPGDLYGRFGGQVFTMLLDRGTLRDIEAWAQNAVARIAARIFEVAPHTLSATCTIGLAEIGPGKDGIEALMVEAKRANKRGRERGGNQVVLEETSDHSTRVQRFDELWVQQIKSALMENRFRLAHLSVANLIGEPKTMFDTVIRMIDAQGAEVPATDFTPAAGRNRLLRSIDRWVIGASLAFCATQEADCVFIKLSSESVIDKTLLEWLVKAVRSSTVEPARLCFQVSEEDATQYLSQTKTLAEELKALGHLFAIEHFGIGHDSQRILTQTPMQYLKIDGSLMQSLATDHALQEQVRGFISVAQKRNIQTIAERVEDANTMAVLFQLGAAYMQGHYVHEPDVVLGESS